MDGFRFAAIATVVLFHYWGYAGSPSNWGVDWVARHGYRGVNLFYVISGFVLGLPFAARYLTGGQAVPLKRYFLRRLTRLEPPYLLNLLICAMVGGVAWPHLAASAVYLHSQIFGEKSLVNPVTWSLEVEVQFYCLAPVLAGLFRIPGRAARRGVLAGLMLGLGLVQLAFWGAPARVLYSIAFALQYFLAGFLLADLYLVDWREAPPCHWGWDVASLVLWPAILLPTDRAIWAALPFLMLAAYVSAFRGRVFRALFRHGWITAIGGMCYTIYLWHFVMIEPWMKRGNGAAGYVAVLAAVSLIYFVLVERPCMQRDWPQRLAARVWRRQDPVQN